MPVRRRQRTRPEHGESGREELSLAQLAALSAIRVGVGSLGFLAVALTLSLLN